MAHNNTQKTVAEFAQSKNVHRNTVLYWIREKQLPKCVTATKIGRTYILTIFETNEQQHEK